MVIDMPNQNMAERVEFQKPIGEEQVRNAFETLKKYKEGKANLEKRIIDDEQYWKMRHWEQMRTGNPNDPQPASGWLVNVILNRHADAMDSYPEPNCLPRAMDDQQEARTLSKVLPVIMKQANFQRIYSDAWWSKLKNGCGAYGIFWDGSLLNGMGDISIRKMNVLNLFWESGITDIQDSANFFSTELIDKKILEEKYPDIDIKGGNEISISKYIYDDTVDTSNKVLVVDWYYKKNGLLHYCKFCETNVLFATENDPQYATKGWYDHGQYPFVFDVLFPEEGTPCGFGFIDICKDAQNQIDVMNQAILKNTIVSATPRYFIRADGSINESEFADYTKAFVHTNGNLGDDSIRPITSSTLSDIYVSILNNKIQELRETSGNTEASTGIASSSVTAASAIAALQEASGKLSRDMIKTTYDNYSKIVLIVIDLIRQFYDIPRTFRITGDYGVEEFTQYSNIGLKPQAQGMAFGVDMGYRTPIIDIDVQPASESRYTKAEYNELALSLYQAGMFNPQMTDQALTALSMMDFKGKDALEQKIQANGTMYQQLINAQQQALQMAQIIDAQNGTNIAEQTASQITGQPVPNGGVNPQNVAVDGDSTSDTTGENHYTKKARQQTQDATKPR